MSSVHVRLSDITPWHLRIDLDLEVRSASVERLRKQCARNKHGCRFDVMRMLQRVSSAGVQLGLASSYFPPFQPGTRSTAAVADAAGFKQYLRMVVGLRGATIRTQLVVTCAAPS